MQPEQVKELRSALRAEARGARASMDPLQRAYKSDEICQHLSESLALTIGLSDKPASECIVALYAAFPEEVNLDAFARAVYEQGCKVAFPCMMHDARGTGTTQQTMEMRVVDAQSFAAGSVPFITKPLKKWNHADAELEAFPYAPADQLDMLVVPVVGFDAQGNRLGYGQGNYDRYLTQLDPDGACRIVGVAFAEQQVPEVPVEPFDIPLPAVLFA